MVEDPSDETLDVAGLAADIVSAYVAHNQVPAGELPDLISAVDRAIRNLETPSSVDAEPLVPAVPVKRSIMPDYIYSLEDGKPYKTLKRHLALRGLTPEQYREKWSLRSDYPMSAANYSKARSELAKQIGLGRKSAASKAVAEPKRGRGRPKKHS